MSTNTHLCRWQTNNASPTLTFHSTEVPFPSSGREVEFGLVRHPSYHTITVPNDLVASPEQIKDLWVHLGALPERSWAGLQTFGLSLKSLVRELIRQIMEANFSPFYDLREAQAAMEVMFDFLRPVVEEHGLMIVGSGLVPAIGKITREWVPEEPAYLRGIFDRHTARGNGEALCHAGPATSSHLHIGNYCCEEGQCYAFRRHNLRTPMMVGLLANSPLKFDDATRQMMVTDVASNRLLCWLGFGGLPISPLFHNREEFIEDTNERVQDGRYDERAKQYWLVALRYESLVVEKAAELFTTELREEDTASSLQGLYVRRAFKVLVDMRARLEIAGLKPGPEWQAHTLDGTWTEREALRERLNGQVMRAANEGLNAMVTDYYSGDLITVQQAVLNTLNEEQDLIAALKIEEEMAVIERMANGQTDYARQLEVFTRQGLIPWVNSLQL